MIKYRYIMCGMFIPTDGEVYEIEIPSPFAYDSKEDCMKDECFGYRFLLLDERKGPEIVIYEKEDFYPIEDNDNEYLAVQLTGNGISFYSFDEFISSGGRIRMLRPEAKNNSCFQTEDFIETDKTFIDVFPNIEPDKLYYIDSESYFIEEIDIDKTNTNSENVLEYNNKETSKDILVKNNNLNQPLADESLYKALAAFDVNTLQGKDCYITKDYVSVMDFNDEYADDIIYDMIMQSVISENEWVKNCYEYTIKQEKERKAALEKQGLFDAYIYLEKYLREHNSIRQICWDENEKWPVPYKIVKKDLTYGYKLTGFKILEDAVIWMITTYERAIKQNDCIRGLDACYLMYKNGMIMEAISKIDYKLLCENNNMVEDMSSEEENEYIAISDIIDNKYIIDNI